jgi:hypothetical protein
MNKQELAEQILKGYSPATRTTDGNYAWEEEDVIAAIVEMGVKQPTHYHVADNSNGFRDWLDKKKIEWMPNGHFTTIPLKGNDIFKLGLEFGLYRKEAMAAPAKAVEAMDSLPAQKGNDYVASNSKGLSARARNWNLRQRLGVLIASYESLGEHPESENVSKLTDEIMDLVASNSNTDENTEGRV